MAENLTVCIARQFGSGGREVGQSLAQKLGIAFYDKELIKAAAEKSGMVEEIVEKNDEKAVSGIFSAPIAETGKMASFADYMAFTPNDNIQHAVAEVIREAAEKGPCVIIGRCSDYILRGRPKTLSVFVHAPLETRIQRISRLHNLPEDEARQLIRKTDRSRANYYSFYTDRSWGDITNYNICIDTAKFGISGGVDILKQSTIGL